MAGISKEFLSGSTNGRPTLITDGATPGQEIHAAIATDYDEVWMWAWNSSAAPVRLTIEMGGASDPGDIFEIDIPPVGNKKTLVIEGMIFTGATVDIDVFAATTSVINVQGFVNRHSKS